MPEQQKRIINRLRRAQGQLNAVVNAVEAGEPCQDVVTQLAAAIKALERAGIVMITSAMQECLNDPDAALKDDGVTPQDFEKLFLMLA